MSIEKKLYRIMRFIVYTFLVILVTQLINTSNKPYTNSGKVLSDKEAVSPSSIVVTEKVKVSRVLDGDTIEIENGNKIRYIGIDTPEIKGDCYADEAKKMNEQLVFDRVIMINKDVSETDRYGRLLRYVYVGDIFVNEYLVKNGFAFARSYPPDISMQNIFKNAENYARENKLGFWNELSGCNL